MIDRGNYRLSVVIFLIILTVSCTSMQTHLSTQQNSDINYRGWLLREQGRYVDALEYHQKALTNHERSLGPEHPLVATSLYDIGVCYSYLSDYERAENYFLESLKIREKVLGANHKEVALNLIRLADLYRNLGDLEKAEPLYWVSLEQA